MARGAVERREPPRASNQGRAAMDDSILLPLASAMIMVRFGLALTPLHLRATGTDTGGASRLVEERLHDHVLAG